MKTRVKKTVTVKLVILTGLLFFIFFFQNWACNHDSETALQAYHQQLHHFRTEFRVKDMPDVKFFLFGMGNREKLLYKNGSLIKSLTGELIAEWPVQHEIIIPNQYRVEITNSTGEQIMIVENETGVFITENNSTRLVPRTNSPVRLPDFSGHKYSDILKVLHQEILVNIIDSKPVPNYFVYTNPWRRDAAMMAMCLQETGNIDLIGNWVTSLDDPYEHNNGSKHGLPENEADNLGQTLYLLSFFADQNHPLVAKILDECQKITIQDSNGIYIEGRSDFHNVPAYQTKWLKFGLRKLGIEDTYTIPQVEDNYSPLFWWDYTDYYVKTNLWKDDKYPYISWAQDHFFSEKTSPISNRIYPLTWEIDASEANYNGMRIIDEEYVVNRISSPHTWHAAEVFLYLLKLNKKDS
ncbi:MAG TPA: hypothetical protein PLP19_06310 [bacterium]|nr:hypothetical protein [bacterium]HPN43081.1 hypothetical protein [bacterium]